jgi:hypothetical protein
VSSLLSPVTPKSGQETEQRQRVLKPKPQVSGQTSMEPKSRPLVLRSLFVEVDQGELDGVGHAYVRELQSGGGSPVRVAGVQGAAEASVGRTLRGHERMFPNPR